MVLDDQLQTYIIDIRVSKQLLGLKKIGDLAQKMVETKKNCVYPLVYRLITLALIFTNCYGYSGESIFCYECYQKSIA